MSAEAGDVYLCTPTTERGSKVFLSAGPKGKDFIYVRGNVVVVREAAVSPATSLRATRAVATWCRGVTAGRGGGVRDGTGARGGPCARARMPPCTGRRAARWGGGSDCVEMRAPRRPWAREKGNPAHCPPRLRAQRRRGAQPCRQSGPCCRWGPFKIPKRRDGSFSLFPFGFENALEGKGSGSPATFPPPACKPQRCRAALCV